MENEKFYYRLGECRLLEKQRLLRTTQEEEEEEGNPKTMQDIGEEQRAKELVRDRRKTSRYLNQYSMYIDVCISTEYYKGELKRPLYICMCVCFIMIIFQ